MGIVSDRTLRRVWCHCDHITKELVDDGFRLELFFDGDLSALVEVGTSNFINMPRFYMTGRDGSALIPEWGQPYREVWCFNYNEKDVVPVKTAAGITKTMAPRDEKSLAEKIINQPHSDVHDYYRNVVRAIDGEEEQIVKHDQLMRVMKVMEAAFESDRLGRPVEFEDR
jgi:predicted dehydrogenase